VAEAFFQFEGRVDTAETIGSVAFDIAIDVAWAAGRSSFTVLSMKISSGRNAY
jgi:hypothetical protein